jgi:hypothetical protein
MTIALAIAAKLAVLVAASLRRGRVKIPRTGSRSRVPTTGIQLLCSEPNRPLLDEGIVPTVSWRSWLSCSVKGIAIAKPSLRIARIAGVIFSL